MVDINAVLQAFQAETLPPKNAPGLYQAMEETATKLNIKTPTFHVVPAKNLGHPLLNGFSLVPNAASLSEKDVIISKPILALFKSKNLKKPITDELKAVLSHEMHHCANRSSLMAMSRMPVLLVPAAAMTGMYIYDKAQQKAKSEGDESKENTIKHIEGITQELKDSLPAKAKSTFTDKLANAGKYMAVAAIGTGAGLWVARHGARHHEFAADAFAASQFADREVMVSALRKLHQALGMSIAETPHKEKFKGIIAESILAHPTFAERAAHIRRHTSHAQAHMHAQATSGGIVL